MKIANDPETTETTEMMSVGENTVVLTFGCEPSFEEEQLTWLWEVASRHSVLVTVEVSVL